VDTRLWTLGLLPHPQAASVVALEATACAVLRRTDFARVLADRLSQANERAGIDFVTLSKYTLTLEC